ncbi:MAG: class I SAM-dependent methyltransferase [Flavobacteriales bacterium]
MSWYRNWFGTRYYALLYGHRDLQEAASWARMILGRWDLGTGAHVLDVACGRGRHAALFLAEGMQVTGVDISTESIADAREAVPDAEFIVHDMREPLADGGFDAAYCLFTSLGYSRSVADDRRIFRNVADALRPGGRFVVDFMNTRKVLRDLVPQECLSIGNVRFLIERVLEDGVLVKRITVLDGEVEHRFEERVLTLMPEDLTAMAEEAGLVIEDRTDGPVPEPFNEATSSRFVLWSRKPA